MTIENITKSLDDEILKLSNQIIQLTNEINKLQNAKSILLNDNSKPWEAPEIGSLGVPSLKDVVEPEPIIAPSSKQPKNDYYRGNYHECDSNGFGRNTCHICNPYLD